ncbi:HSP18 transcriptional regulator, partial [Streptomyces sp. WM6372]
MNEAAEPTAPIPFLAAAAALEAIDRAVKDAQQPSAGTPGSRATGADAGLHPALAALMMLREVREQLAGWESG